jgi:hypothetical protein
MNFRRTGISALALAVLLTTFGLESWSFIPTKWKSEVLALGKSHVAITTDAITAFDQTTFSVSSLTTSMKNAIEQIANENAKVDDECSLRLSCQVHAENHFDGESFPEGQQRIIQLEKALISAMSTNSTDSARQSLGQALHTLQDFYSHSNWIENNNGTPNPDLYNDDPAKKLTRLADNVPTCLVSELTTTGLTSGYFSGLNYAENRPKPNPAKCSHGGPFDYSTPLNLRSVAGINKDSSSSAFSPHFDQHVTAAKVATDATYQFLLDIQKKLTPAQLRMLLGAGPSLAFVIDTTASMGSEIENVKNQAIAIVNDRLGTAEEPSKYVLAPFNDPSVGPVVVTSDPGTFKSAISALYASGGGDCPEYSLTGTLQALGSMDAGGNLFVFTDADAKDAALAGNVAALAKTKKVSVTLLLFGTCTDGDFTAVSRALAAGQQSFPIRHAIFSASVDPSYSTVSSATGGQLFLLQAAEAGTITSLADIADRSNLVNILSVSDTLAGTPLPYDVPVDSSILSISLSVSGATDVTVNRPDGSQVAATDTGVTVVSLSTGALYTLASPVPGKWKITLNGTGSFTFHVLGQADYGLDSMNFMEIAGRDGHSGYFPIVGYPIAAQPANIEAVVAGAPASVSFELRTPAGAVIQPITLSNNADLPPGDYTGQATLPNSPFLVYATGTDSKGNPFERLIAAPNTPQTVSIDTPDSVPLPVGVTTSYTFTVHNFGSADTFAVSATDDNGFVSSVSSTSINIPSNGTATVVVGITPPAGTASGLSDTLTFNVLATSGSTNYTTLASTIETDVGLTVSTVGGGTVTTADNAINCGTACTARFAPGTSVVLTGSAPAGTFLSWNGCTSSSGNTCTVTMNGDTSLVADFVSKTPVISWATPSAIVSGIALSVTQLNATAANSDGTAITGTFTYNPPVGTILSSGDHTLNVTFAPTDSADYLTAQGTVTIAVQDFALPSPSPSITTQSGQTVTASLTISSVDGFAGTVNVACTVPAAMAEASCSATPVTLASGSSGTSTISVKTTASHQTALTNFGAGITVLAVALPLACLFVPGSKRRRYIWFLAFGGLATVLCINGCGGGGGSSPKSDPGTVAGSYTVSITATSGSISHTGSIQVTVQ